MKIQSSHSQADRGLDPYFTPPEATRALLALEKFDSVVWEPAAGDGAISKVLIEAGKEVLSTDIADYGWKLDYQIDYLAAAKVPGVNSIITNPPFRFALEFAIKATAQVPFVALLLRTNFLESTSRLPFFRANPPSRIWISSRRLPMMHRHGWTGPEAPSNTCHAWFIWDKSSVLGRQINWFDWADYQPVTRVNPNDLGL